MRLIAMLSVLAVLAMPAVADENPAVAYCKARGDTDRCKQEMLRGLNVFQEGLAWIGKQKAVGLGPYKHGVDAATYCERRYGPNWLAVGACVDGYLFDRR